MVGNMIYLLFRQDLKNRNVTLIAPHATFDGVMDHMQDIEDFCKKNGLPHERGVDASLTTSGLLRGGKMRWYYFVSSRTILE